MPSLRTAIASNSSWSPTYDQPVAVFIGGTEGIGEAMAIHFAKVTKGKAHIIIIARNTKKGEQLLASLPQPEDAETVYKRQFIRCDASLMENVRETTEILLQSLPKINFLVLSAGFPSFRKKETEEGINVQLALRYYHRFKFIYELLPLLRKARDLDEDSRVLSVLGAIGAFFINPDDFGMKNLKPYFSIKALIASSGYNDYMLDEFANREPGIAFTHIYPGGVNSAQYHYSHWFLKLFSWIIDPTLRLLFTSCADSAQYMWYGLLEGKVGFFRRNQKGDSIGRRLYPGYPEVRKALWDHSIVVTRCE